MRSRGSIAENVGSPIGSTSTSTEVRLVHAGPPGGSFRSPSTTVRVVGTWWTQEVRQVGGALVADQRQVQDDEPDAVDSRDGDAAAGPAGQVRQPHRGVTGHRPAPRDEEGRRASATAVHHGPHPHVARELPRPAPAEGAARRLLHAEHVRRGCAHDGDDVGPGQLQALDVVRHDPQPGAVGLGGHRHILARPVTGHNGALSQRRVG